MEIEARSVELYRKNAAQTADAAEKEIWQKLQAEEEKTPETFGIDPGICG